MSEKLVFSDIEIDKQLISTLDEAGIKEPTEIQEKAIPIMIHAQDLIAQSNTRTGKTVA